jgi:beta-lactamase regulating signal transducer with metallopeptidase domain
MPPVSEPVAPPNSRFAVILDKAALLLPWLWIVGTPLVLLLTTVGMVGAERLRRQSRPVEDSRIAELCQRLAASLKVSFRVGVAVCDRIVSPILVGIVRPVILLPAVAMTGWDSQQLEMVLLHELVHVRRWDNLVNLMQRIIESALFFHPVIWVISNWVRRDREHCCDAAVVGHMREPQVYARLLVTLADQYSQGSRLGRPLATPQAVSSMAEGPLAGRIRRILNRDEQPMQISRKTFAVIFAGVLVVAAVVSRYALHAAAEEAPTGKSNKTSDTKSGEKPAEARTYSGQVTDAVTGKPIAGAAVSVAGKTTVRARTASGVELKKLGETKVQTDAAGRFSITLPPDQIAARQSIFSIAVEHPDYITFGRGWMMTPSTALAALGSNLAHISLEPAGKISGTIVTPEGKPAAGVFVRAFSAPVRRDAVRIPRTVAATEPAWASLMARYDTSRTATAYATTDGNGRFEARVYKEGEARLTMIPKDYAIQVQASHGKQGDLGRFVLEKGLTLKGRVLDVAGKPLPNVWVNADQLHTYTMIKDMLPVQSDFVRSALTDQNGDFVMGPFHAGVFDVTVSNHPRDPSAE